MEKEYATLRLSELADLIENLLADAFFNQFYWIQAEISELKNYPDRSYCFLTLVEKEGNALLAKAEAVIWNRNYPIIPFFEKETGIRFGKGIKLLLKVSVDFSAVYGLKLQIHAIDSSYTIGNLELERARILQQLLDKHPEVIRFSDGIYLTVNKKHDLPPVIQRIALVTAPDSDGYRDFMHELQNNSSGYQFEITPFLTQIQGKGAAQSIVGRLAEIERKRLNYDVVVIIRGGGSQLDFGPFDTYETGLAVAAFPLPVITGIGHERNVSITDLMSHSPVKTPTKAAAFILDHNENFEEEIKQLFSRAYERAGELFLEKRRLLDRLHDKYQYVGRSFLQRRQFELTQTETRLFYLNPERILEKGFALVFKHGKLVTQPDDLKTGEVIEIKLQQEVLRAEIKEKYSSD